MIDVFKNTTITMMQETNHGFNRHSPEIALNACSIRVRPYSTQRRCVQHWHTNESVWNQYVLLEKTPMTLKVSRFYQWAMSVVIYLNLPLCCFGMYCIFSIYVVWIFHCALLYVSFSLFVIQYEVYKLQPKKYH